MKHINFRSIVLCGLIVIVVAGIGNVDYQVFLKTTEILVAIFVPMLIGWLVPNWLRKNGWIAINYKHGWDSIRKDMYPHALFYAGAGIWIATLFGFIHHSVGIFLFYVFCLTLVFIYWGLIIATDSGLLMRQWGVACDPKGFPVKMYEHLTLPSGFIVITGVIVYGSGFHITGFITIAVGMCIEIYARWYRNRIIRLSHTTSVEGSDENL